jgi:hypothetical protein
MIFDGRLMEFDGDIMCVVLRRVFEFALRRVFEFARAR